MMPAIVDNGDEGVFGHKWYKKLYNPRCYGRMILRAYRLVPPTEAVERGDVCARRAVCPYSTGLAMQLPRALPDSRSLHCHYRW